MACTHPSDTPRSCSAHVAPSSPYLASCPLTPGCELPLSDTKRGRFPPEIHACTRRGGPPPPLCTLARPRRTAAGPRPGPADLVPGGEHPEGTPAGIRPGPIQGAGIPSTTGHVLCRTKLARRRSPQQINYILHTYHQSGQHLAGSVAARAARPSARRGWKGGAESPQVMRLQHGCRSRPGRPCSSSSH